MKEKTNKASISRATNNFTFKSICPLQTSGDRHFRASGGTMQRRMGF